MLDESGIVRRECQQVLAEGSNPELSSALTRLGRDPVPLVRQFDGTSATQRALRDLKHAALGDGGGEGDDRFERYVLVRAALDHLDLIRSTALPTAVQWELYAAFRRLAHPDPKLQAKLRLGHSWFISACKIATLRRFPAGQYEWEVSGLPRSWLLKVERRRLPRLLCLVGMDLKGFKPFFVPHLGILRPQGHLDQEEVHRSHYRMAEALELQPHIKGMVAASWMRAPDVGRHSPRLAWLPQFFRDNGGLVADMGPADPKCGVLSRSKTRQRLNEEGRLNPRVGLVVWPREAMLRWAALHPGYGA
jgi:hypothetical protein